jgi:hypothetical protein
MVEEGRVMVRRPRSKSTSFHRSARSSPRPHARSEGKRGNRIDGPTAKSLQQIVELTSPRDANLNRGYAGRADEARNVLLD